MDRQSHFKWELTRDELSTIWWALTEKADRLNKEADISQDPVIAANKRKIAKDCTDLYRQINRMRRGW